MSIVGIVCGCRDPFRPCHSYTITQPTALLLTTLTSSSPPSSPAMLRRHITRLAYRSLAANFVPACSPASVRAFATVAPAPSDAFANGTNAYYVDEMYRSWKQDPNSVHVSWRAYFSGMDHGLKSQDAYQSPPTFLPQPVGGAPTLTPLRGAQLDDHLKVCTNTPSPLRS